LLQVQAMMVLRALQPTHRQVLHTDALQEADVLCLPVFGKMSPSTKVHNFNP